MARSKNRLVDYDKGNGEILTARLELENGEVVEGHYEVYCWLQPPYEVGEEATRRMSLPPVATYGKIKQEERDRCIILNGGAAMKSRYSKNNHKKTEKKKARAAYALIS